MIDESPFDTALTSRMQSEDMQQEALDVGEQQFQYEVHYEY